VENRSKNKSLQISALGTFWCILVKAMKEKKVNVKFAIEEMIGCKWSLSVLDMLHQGVNRPGAMVREQDGLSKKVLNERLKKLMTYNVIRKIEYPEVPPRVEYVFTEFGRKFLDVVNAIRSLEDEANR
jgi:DNA-binding HxlR family transcriptional regulator